MVYSRRRRYKRRSYRRRLYKKRRYPTRVTKRFAKKVKKVITKTLETKYVEAGDFSTPYSFTIASVPAPVPAWTPLRYIGQGILKNQRVGAKILIKGIRLTGLLQGGSSASTQLLDDPYNYMRAILFWASPSLDANLVPSIVPNWHQVYRKDTFPAIQRIQADKKMFFRNPIAGSNAQGVDYVNFDKPFNWYFRLNKVITYTGDASNTVSGSDLFLYLISDSSTPPSPAMKWWKLTLTYKDI